MLTERCPKAPPSGELAATIGSRLRGFAPPGGASAPATLHLSRKLSRHAKGSLPEGAGKTDRFCLREFVLLLKRFVLYFFRTAVQSFKNFFDFSQKCNDFFRKIGYTVSCRDSGAATTSPHMIPPHTKAIPQTRNPSGVPQAPEGFLVVSLFFIAIFKNSAYQNGIFAICSLRMLLGH